MKEKYEGMTIKERLFVAKKLDEFDEAVEKKDIDKIISILRGIDLADVSIHPILESLGLSIFNK